MWSWVLLVVFFPQVCAYQIRFSYLIFSLFLLKDKNICPGFPGHFHCHYYFHYVYLWGYKKPPLHLWHSLMQNLLKTTPKHQPIMEHFLSILEQKQQPPEETIDDQKPCYIASQVSIWDYNGIPQANYFTLEKNEKSRIFSDFIRI